MYSINVFCKNIHKYIILDTGYITMSLSDDERLQLKKLISESDAADNTEHIRKVKHSVPIRDSIRAMDTLKVSHKALKEADPQAFEELCKEKARFLYDNYTDIFNKVLKDEIDFRIMSRLLIVLKLIEDEKVDQHEGSVMVGKILKELYLDSAVKHADALNQQREPDVEPEPKVEPKAISWKKYKVGMMV